jgi:hypothetical protein
VQIHPKLGKVIATSFPPKKVIEHDKRGKARCSHSAAVLISIRVKTVDKYFGRGFAKAKKLDFNMVLRFMSINRWFGIQRLDHVL